MTKQRCVLAAAVAAVAAWAGIVVSCGPGVSDYSYDVCGGFRVIRSSSHQIIVTGPGTRGPITVGPKVVEVAWDERYVLAKRQHVRPVGGGGYEKPVPGSYDFWIVDTRDRVAAGPLTAAEFAAKRDALGIPRDVKLNGVASYPKSGD